MRIVPTLLRLILALSLVLNGTGLAAAHGVGADMQVDALAGAHEVPPEDAPCHDAAEPITTGLAAHAQHAVGAGTAEGDAPGSVRVDHHAGTGCCDLGACDNACPQPLSAALVAPGVTALPARPCTQPQLMHTTWAGPRLPHPIRPPIA